MTDSKVKQPQWYTPKKIVEEPVLRVYNSLTRTKTEFVPQHGRLVKWYNCGPTVYDASHMGHARNYVTQDVIRRILRDYFAYDVYFVMNITDIDDKIIIRARQTHLIQRLREQSTSLTPSLIKQVREAWDMYFHTKLSKGLPESDKGQEGKEDEVWSRIVAKDAAWLQACKERDEKFILHFDALKLARNSLEKATKSETKSESDAHALIDSSIDVLSLYLDKKYGNTVTDPSISRSLAAFWEKSFMDDMARLNVQPPDGLTRVTEYIPEIVAFVQRIVDNGWAYVGDDGSVWFNSQKFDGGASGNVGEDGQAWQHTYAKLQPWSKGNRELLDEGEGALSRTTSKRSASDFALWKASKPDEPSWPSPWGPGRPGWHIECSVMASDIFGDNMDIHSGGIDLAFPHHDNEIAQAEAYHECKQWVNYFLHTGHLHIEGLKMSKSLKNFITIEEILQTYSPRQLRLGFLTQLWNARVDFKESLINEVKTMETTFNNFFTVVKALVAEAETTASVSDGRHHYNAAEKELTDALHQAQYEFRVALADSFNTPDALARLLGIVSKANAYLARGRSLVNVSVVEGIARWAGNMLRMFGLGHGPRGENQIGWGDDSSTSSSETDRETMLMPYLRTLSAFRDSVRQLAIKQAPPAEILALSDKLRDVDLVPLGVALDDQEDGKALVKLVAPETLIRARDEKLAQAAEKALKKAAALEAERARKLAKVEKGKIPPQEMFKPPNVAEGVYGSWDDNGLPLTDGEGIELSKGRAKKFAKEWDAQRKAHEEWLNWVKSAKQL